MQSEVVGHETPPTPWVPVGRVLLTQTAPPSVVVRMVLSVPLCPTATHLEVEGHETPSSGSIPIGTGRLVQTLPPSVVVSTPAATVTLEPTATQSVTEGQERSARKPSLLGVCRLTHVMPPSAVVKMVPLPTATQAVVEGQEIPERLALSGRARRTQVLPPSVVMRAALGVEVATVMAMQSRDEPHEMPTTSVTPTGAGTLTQEAPPSVVKSKTSLPTATQSEGDGHETPNKLPTPFGTAWLVHVIPRSVVVTMAGGPLGPPTATQCEIDEHEMLSSVVAGSFRILHVAPAVSVVSMRAPPTATQWEVDGHEMPVRSWVCPGIKGTNRFNQVDPPSVVVSTVLPPTATHSEMEGQAMAERLRTGGSLTSVLHWARAPDGDEAADGRERAAVAMNAAEIAPAILLSRGPAPLERPNDWSRERFIRHHP
jgi:hypothetical protein